MSEFDPDYNHTVREHWEEMNIIPRPEVIVCAANKLNGTILICGARHWDRVMRQQAKAIGGDGRWWSEEEQGFINQYGEFRTRKEAMRIVKENGQLFDADRNGSSVCLYSEGLY